VEVDKKVVAAALVILFGSNAGSIINAYNPGPNQTAFSRTEGRELRTDIDELKEWRIHHERWGEQLGRENSNQMAALKSDVRANSYLIKQCMKATGTGR
jgi:hypothetical protein